MNFFLIDFKKIFIVLFVLIIIFFSIFFFAFLALIIFPIILIFFILRKLLNSKNNNNVYQDRDFFNNAKEDLVDAEKENVKTLTSEIETIEETLSSFDK